jgi:hypothetical protein
VTAFLLFLILGIVVGGYYAWSLWRYPRVPCHWCKGRAPRDPLIKGPFGQCGRCDGKGWKPRWGTRLIGRSGKWRPAWRRS